MKNTIYIILLFLFQNSFCQQNYLKTWATYYGDESVIIKDSEIDSQGNIYIVGKVQQNTVSQFNAATIGAHQTTFGGGEADGFISKFNSDGIVVWSTFYGGEQFDRFDDISIDKYDNIYCIGGTFSTQNIATINSFQSTLLGNTDSFIVKLNPNGIVLWNTYFGGMGEEINLSEINEYTSNTGIVNDELGNFYLFTQTNSTNFATTSVFQETRNDANSLIAKFTDDGIRIWSTYYGINNSRILSFDIGQTGIFVSGLAIDCPPSPLNTYFATANCHQPTNGSCSDTFISKFNFDGQRVWSTYYGGTSTERQNSNGLKCANGFVYISGMSSSNTNITTPNSFQQTKISTTYTNYLIKFNENGERFWGTYVGENSNGGILAPICAKIKISLNNVYLYGATILTENISTIDGYQNIKNNDYDGYIVKFNTDGERQWGSYFGEIQSDEIKNVLFNNDSFFLIGKTQSQTGLTTTGTIQPNFLYNNSPWVDLLVANTFIAKFDPNPLSVNEFNNSNFVLYPNPNDGNFSLTTNDNIENYTIELYNLLGKKIHAQEIKSNQNINIDNLNKGVYLLKVITVNGDIKKIKMMVN